MQELLFHAYIAAVGFTVAGLCQSGTQWLTGRPLGFGLASDSPLSGIAGIFARLFAGPAILMRNAVTAALRGTQAPVWLAVATLAALVWSFMSGVLVLAVALSLA